MKNTEYLSLYVILDTEFLDTKKADYFHSLSACLKGGATAIQLRSKKMEDREYYKTALRMKKMCAAYSVPFIINDRVDIAVLAKADGVHIGDEDLPFDAVQRIFKGIIGVSADSVSSAIKADKLRASYIGIGPVFTTLQKDKKAMGPGALKKLSVRLATEIVAIGGINEYNMLVLKKNGIKNFSFISAILGSKNIRKKTEEIKKIILS
jgi:thiamine-phosphate pyrophosphorylase